MQNKTLAVLTLSTLVTLGGIIGPSATALAGPVTAKKCGSGARFDHIILRDEVQGYDIVNTCR